jgi:Arm DNA-binding domain
MLAKRPLTDRSVAAIKAAEPGKRHLYWDAVVPGLAVRVTDTGVKAFVLVKRFPGNPNPTARSIGKVGSVTLEAARTQAREWLAQLAAGRDPAKEAELRKRVLYEGCARSGCNAKRKHIARRQLYARDLNV